MSKNEPIQMSRRGLAKEHFIKDIIQCCWMDKLQRGEVDDDIIREQNLMSGFLIVLLDVVTRRSTYQIDANMINLIDSMAPCLVRKAMGVERTAVDDDCFKTLCSVLNDFKDNMLKVGACEPFTEVLEFYRAKQTKEAALVESMN